MCIRDSFVFFSETHPVSSIAKPHCMKKTRIAPNISQKVSRSSVKDWRSKEEVEGLEEVEEDMIACWFGLLDFVITIGCFYNFKTDY